MASVAGDDLARVAALAGAGARRRSVLLICLTVLLACASIASLGIGAVEIPIGDTARAVLGLGGVDTQTEAIIHVIRLPRLTLALAAGAVLGICGAVMQAFFRNPLADPGLLGISNGAALGAAISIVLGGGIAASLPAYLAIFQLPVAAFIGSFVALSGLFVFGRRNGVISSAQMLLAGIAISALAGSGVGYLTFLSTDEQLRTLTFWMLGSLGGATWDQIAPSVALSVSAAAGLLFFAGPLNAYLLGEREARHLGVNVEALKRAVILLVALGVGSSVAVTGAIGFIGLAAPHLVRMAAGADHRVVLPGSALAGALLIVVSDIIARTVVAPAELPIGVLTSLFGGPLFLWLLMSRRGRFQ